MYHVLVEDEIRESCMCRTTLSETKNTKSLRWKEIAKEDPYRVMSYKSSCCCCDSSIPQCADSVFSYLFSQSVQKPERQKKKKHIP
jgi:hypothetical protein